MLFECELFLSEGIYPKRLLKFDFIQILHPTQSRNLNRSDLNLVFALLQCPPDAPKSRRAAENDLLDNTFNQVRLPMHKHKARNF